MVYGVAFGTHRQHSTTRITADAVGSTECSGMPCSGVSTAPTPRRNRSARPGAAAGTRNRSRSLSILAGRAATALLRPPATPQTSA